VPVASDGTYAYTAGGYVSGVASSAAYRYDPGANTWTPLPPMPAPRYAVRAVYAANTNSVYVFGGYDGSSVTSTTFRYDIAGNSWSAQAPMPGGRYFANLAYYPPTGKIYVIGGFDTSFAESGQTWEYDPAANTWNTARAPIPVVMAGSAVSQAGP